MLDDKSQIRQNTQNWAILFYAQPMHGVLIVDKPDRDNDSVENKTDETIHGDKDKQHTVETGNALSLPPNKPSATFGQKRFQNIAV
ncbi:hypothetical protein A3SI_02603 [Nitritalea halalkaliphila LW7]|uniref:Uncharacterized protein n=1 Tax=Nitritalea halalkaliphila LW7 TaxID=1189621 RepID=I5C9C8_9BACT|nr:hypothetical protein [Nitritalea halalkaliphila]EIM78430.1 hypothetical protein A3SI_02603 [Nitritalea halalkaliphila LW7]